MDETSHERIQMESTDWKPSNPWCRKIDKKISECEQRERDENYERQPVHGFSLFGWRGFRRSLQNYSWTLTIQSRSCVRTPKRSIPVYRLQSWWCSCSSDDQSSWQAARLQSQNLVLFVLSFSYSPEFPVCSTYPSSRKEKCKESWTVNLSVKNSAVSQSDFVPCGEEGVLTKEEEASWRNHPTWYWHLPRRSFQWMEEKANGSSVLKYLFLGQV